MTLVQITPSDAATEQPEDDEEGCYCCLNRVRVAALKRRRHAAWLDRGERRKAISGA